MEMSMDILDNMSNHLDTLSALVLKQEDYFSWNSLGNLQIAYAEIEIWMPRYIQN